METASLLRSNGVFQYLTALRSFPDPQTLRRFLLNALSMSESNYTVRTIDCCKGSSTCPSIARVSSSIYTAPLSPRLVIKKALKLATIRAIAGSDPTTRYSAWKRSSGMLNGDAAMQEPGQAARNCWPVVFSPAPPTFVSSGCGPMAASVTGRFSTGWKCVPRPLKRWFRG